MSEDAAEWGWHGVSMRWIQGGYVHTRWGHLDPSKDDSQILTEASPWSEKNTSVLQSVDLQVEGWNRDNWGEAAGN